MTAWRSELAAEQDPIIEWLSNNVCKEAGGIVRMEPLWDAFKISQSSKSRRMMPKKTAFDAKALAFMGDGEYVPRQRVTPLGRFTNFVIGYTALMADTGTVQKSI